MTYFIFGKNLNNVSGALYRIAENQSDLNNLNINVADYFIKEVTENDFLNVKNGLKNCNGYDSNNNIILEDKINLYKDKKALQNEINFYKQFIEDFLNNNKNHPNFSQWNLYLNQLNSLNLNTITYPLNKSLEQHFNDLGQPSYSILQLP
jgi:hypothetical protein